MHTYSLINNNKKKKRRRKRNGGKCDNLLWFMISASYYPNAIYAQQERQETQSQNVLHCPVATTCYLVSNTTSLFYFILLKKKTISCTQSPLCTFYLVENCV